MKYLLSPASSPPVKLDLSAATTKWAHLFYSTVNAVSKTDECSWGVFMHQKFLFYLLLPLFSSFLVLCCDIPREGIFFFLYSPFVQQFAQVLSAATTYII